MITEYITYQAKVRNLAANTLRGYEKDLRAFARWASPQGLRWSTIAQADIDTYTSMLHDKGRKPASIRRAISSIRTLLSWAHHQQIIESNVARYCQSPKLSSTLPMPADMKKLAAYLDSPTITSQAATIHAIVALILDTGMRIQECLDVRCQDIDVKQHTIKVHGKGRKERLVYFTERTIKHCARVANKRAGYLIDESDQKAIRYMMYAECGTHPHAIRHTWAMMMLNNGAPIESVSALMGHASVKTTERYAKLVNTTLAEHYKQYHS